MRAMRHARTPRSAFSRSSSRNLCRFQFSSTYTPPFRRFSMQSSSETLRSWGYKALTSPNAMEKTRITLKAAEWWKDVANKDSKLGDAAPPSSPVLPARPLLYAPRDMPRLKHNLSETLLHNLAHIELNAVEIGWDLVLRFQHPSIPTELYSDWLSILADEAQHFQLLDARLHELGSEYGALPAHNNLWKVAEQTADSLLARIAMVQLVQEARGLDSHERLVSKFHGVRDAPSAKLIDKICKEEVRHVQIGVKWFTHFCNMEGKDPISTFHKLVEEHVDLKRLPPPFNTRARKAAGLDEQWYLPIAFQRTLPS